MFESEAQTLINTVNTVGVMGKGVALQFKKRFPDMFEDYKRRCARGEVKLGEPYLFRRLMPPHVLNFPTKEHWRSVSNFSDILRGLDHLERHYQEWGITSLACPPLGCGHGGLEWRVVGPMLYQRLSRLAIPVTLYAPFGTPHEELRPTYLGRDPGDVGIADEPEHFAPSKVNPAWVALVEVLAQLEENPYHWPVGRTSFQKLAYFATEAGLPTGLDFVKEWKRRRDPAWEPEEVATTIRQLALRGWIDVRPSETMLDSLHEHGVPSRDAQPGRAKGTRGKRQPTLF